MVAELAAAELPGSQGKGKPSRRPTSGWAPRRLIATWSERPRPTCEGGLWGETNLVLTFRPFWSMGGQTPIQANVTLAPVK